MSNLVYSLSLEPIPRTLLTTSFSKGGDSLGLTPSEGPLLVVLLTATWTNAADDAIVSDAANALFDAINADAKALGAYSGFKYLNYAAITQDPIEGYGSSSKAKLQAASKKYDPKGIFQTAVPGGFKLFK